MKYSVPTNFTYPCVLFYLMKSIYWGIVEKISLYNITFLGNYLNVSAISPLDFELPCAEFVFFFFLNSVYARFLYCSSNPFV